MQRQELQLELQEEIDAAQRRAATAVAQRAELEEKCKKLFSGQMTAQEQTAMAEERAKEERVTLMAKNATRRIKNQGLLKGWTSWHGDWAAAARRRRMLAAAGSRLAKPAVTAAFANWREDWSAAQTTLRGMTQHQQLAAETRRRQALERAVEVMQAQHASQLEAAKQQHERGLERQRIELSGSAGEQMALAEERAKEERVTLMAKNATRRIKNQGLIKGWTSWHGDWAAAARRRRMLAAASSRLSKPAATAAFAHWRAGWEGVEKAHLAQKKMSLSQQLAQEQARSGALEASLHELRSEHSALTKEGRQGSQKLKALEQKVAQMLNGQLSSEQQLAFATEQAKENRVQLIAESVLRRIVQRGLARGWTTWHGQWAGMARRKRMLAAAGGRLQRPMLTAALWSWRTSWAAAMRERAGMSHVRLLKESESEKGALGAQMRQLKAEHAQQLDAAAGQRARLEAKLRAAGLETEDMQHDAVRKEAERRERRVADMQQRAVRRISNQGIMRGWSRWQEEWYEKAKQKRMLRSVGSRLLRPKVVLTLNTWKADWVATQQAQVARQLQLQLAEQLRTQEAREAEMRSSGAEQAGHAVADLERAHAEMLEREKEARVEHLHIKAAKRITNQGIIRGFSAWQYHFYEEARLKRLLVVYAAKMCRPALVAAFVNWQREATSLAKAAAIKAVTSAQGAEAKALKVQYEARLKVERKEASVARRALDAHIRELEQRIREYGMQVPQAPPGEPVSIVLFNILAKRVPDADADGGSDPYARFVILVDDVPKADVAYTSYLKNSINPEWVGERLQLALAPEDVKPTVMRVELWDKDMQTPDDVVASCDVVLDQGREGDMNVSLKGIGGAKDVPEFLFSYSLLVVPEPVQPTRKATLVSPERRKKK